MQKPNIILIMTDDQGYGDLAIHGNPWIKTPEMDKLYGESVRLTDFHVGTTCSPTRAGLITGRNCNEVGVWHTIIGRNFLRQGELTIADILKENGYRTGIFGKWHLGDNYPYLPQYRGFEESVVHGGGGVGQTPDFWNNDYFDDTYFRNGEPEKFKGYCTDIWFREATTFIESKKDEPFFCYITPNAPHGPYHVPQQYIDIYAGNDSIPNPNFYGMITNIDENLGMLRQKLEELEIADNTILVFMTDNGTSSGVKLDENGYPTGIGYNAGMRGKKGSPYEGGHRVPFFIHWKGGGLAHDEDIAHIASYTDVVPTLLDLCNIEHNPTIPFEGESFKSLLLDPSSQWKSRTLITDTQRKEFLVKWKDASIMNDDYRLIRGEELYDYKSDPGQTTNVAEQFPEVVKEMRNEYEQWWDRVSQRSEEINPIPIGFNDEAVRLTSHDIHTDNKGQPAWHQIHVRNNRSPEGFWIIEVEEKGKYSIDVHRYPRETGVGFNEAIPIGDKIDGGNPLPEGLPIDVSTIEIKIGEQIEYITVGNEAKKASFEVELDKGEAELSTTIIDKSDKRVGAYYVYIQKV
jgi:arylsulfatase A-like enzyme